MKAAVAAALGTALAVPAIMAIPAGKPQVAGDLKLGNQKLAAASCTVRHTAWINHYAAALYVPPKVSPVDAVQDPKRPKALQVLILNTTFLPSSLPKKWKKTLEGQLDGGTLQKVTSAYKDLEAGDLITLSYDPGPGVKLDVNGETVAASRSHALIDALLRDFADGKPVPERLTNTLQKHPC